MPFVVLVAALFAVTGAYLLYQFAAGTLAADD
jgi:hypothetical protein